MRISIFGLGYVGSVSLACHAENDHTVIGVDINQAKVDLINSGQTPIIEPQITELIVRNQRRNKISATTDPFEAVMATDLSFICVGTPSTSNGHLNLTAVKQVSKQIGEALRHKKTHHIVAIRSTVMPGTNKVVTDMISQYSLKESHQDFTVVSNPEFLREGTAVSDFNSPPYTLIGTTSGTASEVLKELYRNIKAPFLVTDIFTAEIIKYVNNAFHALKVTFANEIGNICKALQIDSHLLMQLFCLDTKLNISSSYLKPGFAYGGSCLTKDLKALRTIAHDNYVECPVLDSIPRSNELQIEMVLNKILDFGRRNVGFLGLAFKPGTDDLRESPIIEIIERLLGKGFNVLIYDYNVNLSNLIGSNREYILQKIPYISNFLTNSTRKMIAHSELIVIVNNDKIYSEILDELNNDTLIYDLVNFAFEQRSQLHYEGIAW